MLLCYLIFRIIMYLIIWLLNRHEFYQKPEEAVVTIFAKGIPKQNVKVEFGEQIVSILQSDEFMTFTRIYEPISLCNMTLSIELRYLSFALSFAAECCYWCCWRGSLSSPAETVRKGILIRKKWNCGFFIHLD